MAGSSRAAVCGLLTGFFAWALGGASLAQDLSAPPEVVPAPPPSAASPQARPQATHWPLQAGQDAYRMAEEQRRRAVEQQRQLIQSAWEFHGWPAAYYVPGVAPVYGYGYAYVPRWAVRRAYRYGYWAVPQPWPYPPAAVYAYPYAPGVSPPQIVPNGQVYRPDDGQAAGRRNVPTPAAPRVPAPSLPSIRPGEPAHGVMPPGQPDGPALRPPIQPVPEPIPAPAAEPVPGDD